jgi:hypothetical protein
MFEVIDTANKVAQESRLVKVDRQALVTFSRKVVDDGIEVPPWDDFHHFYGEDEDTNAYLLVLDSLNFCFWPAKGKEKWEIEYKSEWFSGYYGLAISLKKAIELSIPITDAGYLSGLSFYDLERILGGRGDLQLMDQRLSILHELGEVLIKEYAGQAHKLVEAAGHSATKLARLMADKISSFRDVAEYSGYKVFFHKRAQIFAADLYGSFRGKRWGSFTDMDRLTAFADYKLPQVLRHLGILRYESALADKVDQKILLEPASPEEVEIRANTILAVELIRQELDRMGKHLKSFEIDWVLWNMGQDKSFKIKPYHRTVTIFY